MAKEKHKLEGNWHSRQIWLDDKELLPGPSQKIINHSPDGFNWGYGGSGPGQLALAICHKIHPETAVASYQRFKFEVVANLPQDTFTAEFTSIGNPKLKILSHDMGDI